MTDSTPLAGRRALGRSDLQVAELCLGGNVFGWTIDSAASFDVLDHYVAAGGNFIDTADAYSHWVPGNSGGESEAIIGDWLAARGNRADVVIATKVAKLPSAAGLAPSNVARALDDSLRRLRTDYVDVYYAHEDDTSIPVEEWLGGFDALVQSGKVRYIAASNFEADRLELALETSRAAGLAEFVALQNHYNLAERSEYESQLRDVVAKHGLASLPYYGLARGFLTGKYRGGESIDSPRAAGVAQYLNERGERILTAVEAVATRHETSSAAIALAWLLVQPTVTSPLSSARNIEQLNTLLDMTRISLTEQDLEELDVASA